MSAAAGQGTADGPKPFPWEAVLHAGLCLLRLEPKSFWAMTPVEFHAMTGGLGPRRVALERTGLEAMMTAFPDSPPPS